MLVTRREMDERARRRSMQDRAAAHYHPSVPARSTDAVVNWLMDVRAEIRDVRSELESLREEIDSNNDDVSLTQLETRVEDLEAQIG